MILSATATANARRSAPEFRDTSASGPYRSLRLRAISTPRIRSGLSKCVALFLIGLFIPWLWTIGPIVISPYRVVLIITILPCLAIWIKGQAGGIFFADIMILFYSFWCVVSLAAVHDIDTAVMTGYFVVGWTVLFWNATYVLFPFLLGSGSWLLDAGANSNTSNLRPEDIGRSPRRHPVSKRTPQPAPTPEQR